MSSYYATYDRWSDDLTCKFVTKYVESRILWDKSHPKYWNRSIRIRVTQELADSMGIEGFGRESTRNKIRSLRATYLGETDKAEQSAAAGDDPPHRPLMRWYQLMRPAMLASKRKTIGREVDDDQRRKRRKIDMEDSSLVCERRQATPFAPESTEAEEDAEGPARLQAAGCGGGGGGGVCRAFGGYVAAALQELPLRARVQAQVDIQRVLGDALMKAQPSADDGDASDDDQLHGVIKTEVTNDVIK